MANANVEIKQVKYVRVPYADSPCCWQCKTALKFPYYWLKWEQELTYGCMACV